MRASSSWRRASERARLRPYVSAAQVDEAALRKMVKPLLTQQDRAMKQMVVRGVKHNEALLANSKAFSDTMSKHCMAAMLERDQRVVRLAKKGGAKALAALRNQCCPADALDR